MSYLLSAELAATCNSLGYFDLKTKKYHADSNTLETVKDLIRYLRRDDETHEIRRYFGQSQVLQTDLLPLLKNYWEQDDLFDVLLRVIVNLTSPALMLWQEHVPTEKTARYHYMQIEEHQQKYKQSFADESVWAVLSTRLSKILETDFAERGEENNLIVERILILIRNVLYIPANPEEERRPDNDASIHDQVLWSLHQSGMLDIILFIVSSTTEQAYYMHVLEILSFMLREQKATELAHTGIERSQTEKMRDEAELVLMRHHENTNKQQKVKKFCGARHSRFGGTYVTKSLQAISEKEYIYHKPLNNLDSIKFDVAKKKTRTRKDRLPFQETSTERRSAFSVKLILKEFCIEFLNAAYNSFMYYVRDNFLKAKSQAHDESYYLWALRFFMEFNRGYKFEVKLVSETISVQSFHFVQQQMEQYYDYIVLNKKQCRPWSRRLHIALLAYRELLMTICAMDKTRDEGVRKSAKVIKSTIFYVLEYRELIVTLLISYDEILFSYSYLNDLIETQHIFLKMLEIYCGKENDFVVQGKTKKIRKKKKSAVAAPPKVSEPNYHETWNEVAPQLSVLLGNSENLPEIVPFDATSDVPIDEQKSEAMKNIQNYLRDFEFENALGLLRASREVWAEHDCFGSSTMAPEEELLVLQDIFLADLGERIKEPTALEPNIEGEYDEEDDEEMEGMSEPTEANFKFSDFLKRLANQKVVRACSLALKNFEHNSVHANYCILKLLHRIVWDLKMATMAYQVSIFMTFEKIYSLKGLPQYKELVKFATYVLRQFFKLTLTNTKVYMEALFWKTAKDAIDVEEGYGSYHEKSQAEARAWSEAEENELMQLFSEYQEKEVQEDIVDWIINNLVDHTKTRRSVLKKLKDMDLLTNYSKRKTRGSRSNVWTEEEVEKLRNVYAAYKDEDNPLELIANGLLTKRAKTKIVEKLLELGLIQNKNELKKKRSKSSRNNEGDDSQNSNSESENSSDEDDDDNRSTHSSTTVKPQPKKKATVRSSKNKPKAKSKRAKQVFVSRSDLIKLLLKVSDMTDALDWLRESLSDIIEDRKESDDQDDDDEGDVPLVAIMDYSTTAMENSDFQNLLQGFQIRQPADEQEIHWRIPNNLTSSTLEEYCQLLTDALENKLAISEEANITAVDENSNSEDEDVFDKLKLMTRRDDDDSSNLDVPSTSSHNAINTRTNREIDAESGSSRMNGAKRAIIYSDDNSNSGDEDVFDTLKRTTRHDVPSTSSHNSENARTSPITASKQSDTGFESASDVLPNGGMNDYPTRRVTKRLIIDSDDDEEDKENRPEKEHVLNKRSSIESDSNEENNTLNKDENKREREASDNDSPLKMKKRSRLIVSDDDSS